MAIYRQRDLKRYYPYRGIWVVFLTLWLGLGIAVAAFPVVVARLLRGKDDPSSRLLTAWRMVGAVVPVGSAVKLFSVLAAR
jgi:hypothetical protein